MAGDDGVCRVRTIREAKQSGVDRSSAEWPFALEMAMNGAWIHYGALPTSTPCRWT